MLQSHYIHCQRGLRVAFIQDSPTTLENGAIHQRRGNNGSKRGQNNMEHFKHFEHMVWMMNKMKSYIHLYENQHVPTFNDDLVG